MLRFRKLILSNRRLECVQDVAAKHQQLLADDGS